MRLVDLPFVKLEPLNIESVDGVFNRILDTSGGVDTETPPEKRSGSDGPLTGSGSSIDILEKMGIGTFKDSCKGLTGVISRYEDGCDRRVIGLIVVGLIWGSEYPGGSTPDSGELSESMLGLETCVARLLFKVGCDGRLVPILSTSEAEREASEADPAS